MTSQREVHRLASIGLIALTACATTYTAGGDDPEGMSARIGSEIYVEYGDVIDVLVGLRPARYREADGYVPVEIAVANHGRTAFALPRHAFTLVEADGTTHPPVEPRDLLENYRFLDMDREALAQLPEAASTTFGRYFRHPSKLSPTRGFVAIDRYTLNVVQDTVLIPRFGYIVDILYFRAPDGGVRGRALDLEVESDALPQPLLVRFVVK